MILYIDKTDKTIRRTKEEEMAENLMQEIYIYKKNIDDLHYIYKKNIDDLQEQLENLQSRYRGPDISREMKQMNFDFKTMGKR